MYHLHYTNNSRDCDGPHQFFADYVPDREDIDFSDPMDVAMNFVMPMLFSVPEHGDDPVSIGIDFDERGNYVLTSGKRTEEGFTHDTYVVCNCEDFEPGSSQRDVFAEQMGY